MKRIPPPPGSGWLRPGAWRPGVFSRVRSSNARRIRSRPTKTTSARISNRLAHGDPSQGHFAAYHRRAHRLRPQPTTFQLRSHPRQPSNRCVEFRRLSSACPDHSKQVNETAPKESLPAAPLRQADITRDSFAQVFDADADMHLAVPAVGAAIAAGQVMAGFAGAKSRN